MGKGIVIDFMAPAEEDDESADVEETPAPSSSADSIISSIEAQLADLRRQLAESA